MCHYCTHAGHYCRSQSKWLAKTLDYFFFVLAARTAPFSAMRANHQGGRFLVNISMADIWLILVFFLISSCPLTKVCNVFSSLKIVYMVGIFKFLLFCFDTILLICPCWSWTYDLPASDVVRFIGLSFQAS